MTPKPLSQEVRSLRRLSSHVYRLYLMGAVSAGCVEALHQALLKLDALTRIQAADPRKELLAVIDSVLMVRSDAGCSDATTSALHCDCLAKLYALVNA